VQTTKNVEQRHGASPLGQITPLGMLQLERMASFAKKRRIANVVPVALA
jgi:hypothetical protein